jgi:hypothetical protein
VVSAGVAAGAIAGLAEIKSVYVLPMSNGLDQYLASQLTMGSVVQVVTDPLKADVIFTDHLGGSFEQQLDELFGAKPQAGDAPDEKGDGSKGYTRTTMQGQRGRGTVFLVDRKSRAVVWSDYEEPKYPTPDGMRRVASRIANKLAQAIKAK